MCHAEESFAFLLIETFTVFYTYLLTIDGMVQSLCQNFKKIKGCWFCNAILLTQFCPELLCAGLSHVLILFISARLLLAKEGNCYLPCLETNYSFTLFPAEKLPQIQGFLTRFPFIGDLHKLPCKGIYFTASVHKKYVLWQWHCFYHSNEVLKNWRYPFNQRKVSKSKGISCLSWYK